MTAAQREGVDQEEFVRRALTERLAPPQTFGVAPPVAAPENAASIAPLETRTD
jgi:hypothetical protein